MIRIRSRGRVAVIAVLAWGLCTAGVIGVAAGPASAAATINVPGDQPTIQAGINAASNGDTVVVAPGTYFEHINFNGKAIEVKSSAGPASTIIDGSSTGAVVTFDNSEPASSVLRGFTIQHGGDSGIKLYSVSAVVTGNNIVSNHGTGNGGGISVQFGAPQVTDNTITDNFGSGVDLYGSAGVVQGNTVQRNSLGVEADTAGTAQIIGNAISDNGTGAGVDLEAAGTPTVSDNVIRGNGAGIVSQNTDTATIIQNLITGNSGLEGAGMSFTIPLGGAGFTIVNNTVADNTTGGFAAVSLSGFYSGTTLANNILLGGLTCSTVNNPIPPMPTLSSNNLDTSQGGCTGVVGSNGNISADPHFLDAASLDYHLQLGSPSVDAGTNAAPLLPSTDLDGKTRIQGGTVDQGAYEYVPIAADPDGEFTSLTPARIVDTRDGTGGRLGSLGAASQFDAQITGRGGVPATGVSAVVLNATVTDTTAASYLTVWPSGAPRGPLSNLNYVPGQTVPNLVTVKVGAGGKVSVYNNAGATDVVFDVVGFYSDATGPAGSRYHAVSPSRYFDTRVGSGGVPNHTIAAGQVLSFKVTGVNGVPATGVTSVVMNVTVTEPTSSGYVTVYPSDVPRPNASSLNFVTGLTVPNLVTVRVPANGVVNFSNFSNFGGTIHLLADVVGYYDGDKSTDGGRFVPLDPQRSIDTRVDPPGPIPGGYALLLQMLGRNGVPFDGVGSVVTNVTVTEPTAAGYVTVFPADQPLPLASNLNYVPGQTVPNLAIAKLSSGPPPVGPQTPGWIAIFNYAGQTQMVVDVFGYFTASFSDVVGQNVPGGSPRPPAMLVPMAQ